MAKKLSVVIADDEVGICELLKSIIEWNRLNLELAGEASNGNAAYDLIQKTRPDIVITDIRMPGLSGLELIQKSKAIHKDIVFIVISGYREFEYAQHALKNGAEDYLLKPINKEELNHLLKRIYSKKQAAASREENATQLNNLLLDSREIIRKNYLLALLFDRNNQNLPPKTESYFEFQDGCFLVLSVKLDYADDSRPNPSIHSSVLESVSEKIHKELADACFDTEFIIIDTKAIFIINYPNRQYATILKKRNALLEIIKNSVYKYSSFELTIGIGREVSDIGDIVRAYDTAGAALAHRASKGTGIIIEYDSLDSSSGEKSPALSDETRNELSPALMALDMPGAAKILGEAFIRLFPNADFYFGCYQFARELIDFLKSFVMELGFCDEDRFLQMETDALHKINNTSRIEQVKNELLGYIGQVVELCAEARKNQDSRPIHTAKQYILENYSRAITLEDVAKTVYLNPVYLGSLFKSKTGVSFSTFLIDTRIAEAKKLLKTTFLSVNEISEKVGYTDTRHFSKLFIKVTGVKPVDYRKFYS